VSSSGGFAEDGLFEIRTLTQTRDVLWAVHVPVESSFGSRLVSRTQLGFGIYKFLGFGGKKSVK